VGRRLGQHFLDDPGILDRIVDGIEPRPDDVVLEIGPGKGSLTRRLAGRVERVVAIERDRLLATRLQEEGIAGCEVVVGDALRCDWHEVLASRSPEARFKVVGNIPYYATTPLIEKALTPPVAMLVVFLVQRELGDRLRALPGSKAYGALSVGVQCVATVEQLFTVSRGAFRPPPKVDSVVVRLTPRSDALVTEEERMAFRRFLTAVFALRRKRIGRILRFVAGLDRERAEDLALRATVDPGVRPEMLAPHELVALYRASRR
jgi:16S rRNA (adenine1518-N6/adenine1519-N6)-dimethyltransferase